MYWYATYDEGRRVVSLIETPVESPESGTAISREAYGVILTQIAQVAAYIGQVASGAMELAEVPEQYREQVAQEIAALFEAEAGA